MKKAYYLLFYKLYSFFKSISDDGFADWKALIIVSGSQVILIIELLVWWALLTKSFADFSKYWLIIPVFSITILNYYIFLEKDRWKAYAKEFKQYPKRKSKVIGWLVFVFLLSILSSLIFAFYQMSLIDWSKYR